ncbi:hypothetical protein BN979_01429 [Mycolicibacterium vulneris]|nr:hypothetical protein BN979_01429 [Mycolicibacterium vulneris]
MARHLTGRRVLSGAVLGGALLAGAVGIAGQANAAPMQGAVPASLQVGGPAPLSSMPAPPLRLGPATAAPAVLGAAASAAGALGPAAARTLALSLKETEALLETSSRASVLPRGARTTSSGTWAHASP